MPSLELKPTHKPVATSYDNLAKFEKLGVKHEGAVRSAFQKLLDHCGRQFEWRLVPEYRSKGKAGNQIALDGGLLDNEGLVHDVAADGSLPSCLPVQRIQMAALCRVPLRSSPLSAVEKMQGDAKPDHDPKASARLFHTFATAGKTLADLHVNYESAPEYKLQRIENKDAKLDYRVEAMKLIKVGTRSTASQTSRRKKDRDAVESVPTASSTLSDGAHRVERPTLSRRCHDLLTLEGIPPETYEYRLGSRSALAWVVDQYRVNGAS